MSQQPSLDPNIQLTLSAINIVVAAIAPIAMVFLSRIAYSECWGTRMIRRLSLNDTRHQESEEEDSILPR